MNHFGGSAEEFKLPVKKELSVNVSSGDTAAIDCRGKRTHGEKKIKVHSDVIEQLTQCYEPPGPPREANIWRALKFAWMKLTNAAPAGNPRSPGFLLLLVCV